MIARLKSPLAASHRIIVRSYSTAAVLPSVHLLAFLHLASLAAAVRGKASAGRGVLVSRQPGHASGFLALPTVKYLVVLPLSKAKNQ